MKELDKVFTESDLERIRTVVGETEEGTSSEIVAYVVEASDEYGGAVWKSGLLFSLMFGLLVGLYRTFDRFFGVDWVEMPPELVFLAAAVGAVLGLALGRALPRWRIGLTTAPEVTRRVERRAALACLDEGVFRTSGRNGILLFLSLLERRVVVQADEDVGSPIDPGAWDEVVADVVSSLQRGRAAEGVIAGIETIGRLLTLASPPQSTGSNELHDDLRRSDR